MFLVLLVPHHPRFRRSRKRKVNISREMQSPPSHDSQFPDGFTSQIQTLHIKILPVSEKLLQHPSITLVPLRMRHRLN